jgi:hypothetical protein
MSDVTGGTTSDRPSLAGFNHIPQQRENTRVKVLLSG